MSELEQMKKKSKEIDKEMADRLIKELTSTSEILTASVKKYSKKE